MRILFILEIIVAILIITQIILPWMFPKWLSYFWFFRKKEVKIINPLNEKEDSPLPGSFEEKLSEAEKKANEAKPAVKAAKGEAATNLQKAREDKKKTDNLL